MLHICLPQPKALILLTNAVNYNSQCWRFGLKKYKAYEPCLVKFCWLKTHERNFHLYKALNLLLSESPVFEGDG